MHKWQEVQQKRTATAGLMDHRLYLQLFASAKQQKGVAVEHPLWLYFLPAESPNADHRYSGL